MGIKYSHSYQSMSVYLGSFIVKKVICWMLLGAMLFNLTSCKHLLEDNILEGENIFLIDESSLEIIGSSILDEHEVVNEPTLIVSEELDKEKRAVKITLTGDGLYYFPALNGEFVEDYQYLLSVNSIGSYQDNPQPMEAPVVAYLPLSYYLIEGNTLDICKVGKDGKHYNVVYELSLDIECDYSEEAITLKNDFLNKALISYFDGEYSERDLLSIDSLNIYYYNPILGTCKKSSNSIYILERNSIEWTVYYYSDYFDEPIDNTPSIIPIEIVEDLKFFNALGNLTLVDLSDGELKELYKSLMKEVSKGYRATENTWSQE